MKWIGCLSIFFLLLTLPHHGAFAGHEGDTEPKWEIGLAGGGGWTPHYPAADQHGAAIAAAPYLIYRGERLRIGEGGLVSGKVVKTDTFDLTVSVSGSLPADSSDNRARAGMPDLDTLVEIGPQLVITLFERKDVDSLKLKLPLRGVVSTDFSKIEYQGVVFQPRLAYSRPHLSGPNLSGSVSLGPIFASDTLMDYFYDVPFAYATPERPAYEASGGYMGSQVSASLTYRITDRFRIFVGGQAAYYDGNVNRDSPLYRSDTGFKIGAGFVWKTWISERTVPR